MRPVLARYLSDSDRNRPWIDALFERYSIGCEANDFIVRQDVLLTWGRGNLLKHPQID